MILFALKELHGKDVLLLLVEQLLVKVSDIPVGNLILGSSDQNRRICLTKAQIDNRAVMGLENSSSGTGSVLSDVDSFYLTFQPIRSTK